MIWNEIFYCIFFLHFLSYNIWDSKCRNINFPLLTIHLCPLFEKPAQKDSTEQAGLGRDGHITLQTDSCPIRVGQLSSSVNKLFHDLKASQILVFVPVGKPDCWFHE